MIKVHKEPLEVTKAFRESERCHFCKTPTIYWSEDCKHPVCEYCSEIYNESDLKSKTETTKTKTLKE